MSPPDADAHDDNDLIPTTPTATAADAPGNRPATQAEMGDPAEADKAAKKAAAEAKAEIGIAPEDDDAEDDDADV